MNKGDSAIKHLISKDGIPIAYERSGTGPPLVLIHGTAADHTSWAPILPEVERHFTVYAGDRRGRGQSGEAEPYTIEHEYEDVVAIVDFIAGSVNLLGHSYGAVCSLEASLKTYNLRKLILYEPPISTHVKKNYGPDAIDRMNSSLQVGERERTLLIFLKEIVGVHQNGMDRLRSIPSWSSRVAAARTIPREEVSVDSTILKPERFSHTETPILLLLGGDSPPFFRAAIEILKRSILHSRIAIMPGQRHAAMDTVPDLFLRQVIEFLGDKK